jgi:proline iminopeptidase
MIPVPRPSRLIPCLALLGLSVSAAATSSTAAQERETIFDRVIHREARAILEIPATPRWEERLGITGRRISVGDAELYVEEEGSGPPMILINGGPGGTHHGFHPWFGRAEEFARVIYYDQRGCGLSEYERGPDGYSVEQAVEDLEGLRVALGLDEVILVGTSYGGFLAQYYTTHYPQNVAGLVLVGASPGMVAELGRSREQMFISPEERDNIRTVRMALVDSAAGRDWTQAQRLALVVYNNHINGDWKRQHYYKPSPERMAQIALYEWVQDPYFRSPMSQSLSRVDLTGAFEENPIPTLIMEGEWDLTWGPEKRDVLAANHPNGRMVVFQEAAHSIYNEDTEGFFTTLEEFVRGLSPVDARGLEVFQEDLARWREAWMATARYSLNLSDWGQGASEAMAAEYLPSWLTEDLNRFQYLRLGSALYDAERYTDALTVFRAFRERAQEEGNQNSFALASIWEGHMLDLLGRREEAVARYQAAVDLDLDDYWQHDQYGLAYRSSPYAAERLQTPFQRIENRQR